MPDEPNFQKIRFLGRIQGCCIPFWVEAPDFSRGKRCFSIARNAFLKRTVYTLSIREIKTKVQLRRKPLRSYGVSFNSDIRRLFSRYPACRSIEVRARPSSQPECP
jgi:hypothetical protein